MKRIFIPLFLAVCASSLWGQQAPQYSLYFLNPYGFNPAYAGLENSLIVTGVYRKQWADLAGAPETQHINMHLPAYILRGGLGIKIENDKIGAHRTTQAALSYNYQMERGRHTLVSLGLSAGYMQYSLDGNILRAPEGTYVEPTFTHNDQYLPDGTVSAGAPVVEAGVFVQTRNLDVGLSAIPVFAPVLKAASDGNFAIVPRQHLMFYSAYRLRIGENLVLKPSVLLKSDFLKTQADLSAVFHWRENIFAGVSFRGIDGRDAVVVLAGLQLSEKTTFAYGFDIPLSPLKTVNRGSHELVLRYNLNKPIGEGKLPPVIYNPRYF